MSRRRGFTLAEAVIAGGIVAIMFAASMAALTVATRTVDPPAAVREARRVRDTLELLRADIESATSIIAASDTSITIAVGDRNADRTEDSIIYTFRTGSRDLVRTDITGTATVVLADVASFDLDTFVARSPDPPAILADATERVLVASPHHGASVEMGPTSLTSYALVTTPLLPAALDSWTVTGLRVRGRRGVSTSNSVTFDLRTVVDGFPTSTVLSTVTVRGGTFPVTTDWVTLDLPDVVLPKETTQVGISATSSSLLAPLYLEGSTVTTRTTPWDTVFSGTLVLWTSIPTYDASYELLGMLTLPQSSLASRIDGVHVAMSVDAAPGETFTTHARVRSRPSAATVVVP